MEAERIILKAIKKGVTYFDTSNIYGPSQLTYGKAFSCLKMIPGRHSKSSNHSSPMKKHICI